VSNTPAARAVTEFQETFHRIRSEVAKAVVGHDEMIENILIAFFAGGHVLIEGVPGTGKTLIVRSLAEVLNLSFNRIQFTVDLMPADITGTRMVMDREEGRREFVFVEGPIFAHILLGDEVNRSTPKTQAALLESMAELQVTVAGTTYRLPPPFFVLATLNPIEMEGTYPLPEAQLDRFFFKLNVPVPGVADMAEIMARTTGEQHARATRTVDLEIVRSMLGLIRQVKIADETMRLALTLVRATHPDADEAPAEVKQYVRYGASPRAAQAIILAAKALALIGGRYHVAAEDVRRVAVPALNHRLILNFHGEMERVTSISIVERVLAATSQA